MALALPFLAGNGLRPILPEGGEVSDEDVEPSAPPGIHKRRRIIVGKMQFPMQRNVGYRLSDKKSDQ